MDIKMNTDAALLHSNQLQTNANQGEQTIQYASESNITAVPSGKSQSETALQAVSAYRSALQQDAKRVADLNDKWQAFDSAIAQTIS